MTVHALNTFTAVGNIVSPKVHHFVSPPLYYQGSVPSLSPGRHTCLLYPQIPLHHPSPIYRTCSLPVVASLFSLQKLQIDVHNTILTGENLFNQDIEANEKLGFHMTRQNGLVRPFKSFHVLGHTVFLFIVLVLWKQSRNVAILLHTRCRPRRHSSCSFWLKCRKYILQVETQWRSVDRVRDCSAIRTTILRVQQILSFYVRILSNAVKFFKCKSRTGMIRHHTRPLRTHYCWALSCWQNYKLVWWNQQSPHTHITFSQTVKQIPVVRSTVTWKRIPSNT